MSDTAKSALLKPHRTKTPHIIVMGAGVIGVTSAWYLRQHGFDVTVIDRQPAVGQETSKANGGQISVSHAEPWANPNAPRQILKWLFHRDAPLKFYPTLDTRQWRWCLQFLRECQHSRTQRNVEKLVTLGMYSRHTLAMLRDELALDYQQTLKGILHFYTQQRDFEHAKPMADYMSQLGCERQVLSAREALTIEPALASVDGLVGATYTATDESGNALAFTQQLAAKCQQAGVRFLTDTHIERIHQKHDTITHIRIKQPDTSADIQADSYVICLGSYSHLLTKQVGLNLLVYPAKGYSITLPVTDANSVPETSLTDDAYKLVFSRFRTESSDQFRVAGMAEIQGGKRTNNTDIHLSRAVLITQRVQQLFPAGLDFSQPHYWTGLRPTTPSNVPYIRQSPISNLYLNTGHGTLGWTHACGSGKLLADIVAGKTPDIASMF